MSKQEDVQPVRKVCARSCLKSERARGAGRKAQEVERAERVAAWWMQDRYLNCQC